MSILNKNDMFWIKKLTSEDILGSFTSVHIIHLSSYPSENGEFDQIRGLSEWTCPELSLPSRSPKQSWELKAHIVR